MNVQNRWYGCLVASIGLTSVWWFAGIASAAEPSASQCGTAAFATTQSLTGYITNRGPFAGVVDQRRRAVAVLYEGGSPKCTGTLVTDDVVLTAAQCTGLTSAKFDDGAGGQRTYDVSATLESGIEPLDYRYLRLAGSPKVELGITPTPLAGYVPNPRDP